jgi:hypothetical protein
LPAQHSVWQTAVDSSAALQYIVFLLRLGTAVMSLCCTWCLTHIQHEWSSKCTSVAAKRFKMYDVYDIHMPACERNVLVLAGSWP